MSALRPTPVLLSGLVDMLEVGLTLVADFDWATRVTRVSGLRCARSTTRVIQLNSDDRDHGDKALMKINKIK